MASSRASVFLLTGPRIPTGVRPENGNHRGPPDLTPGQRRVPHSQNRIATRYLRLRTWSDAVAMKVEIQERAIWAIRSLM